MAAAWVEDVEWGNLDLGMGVLTVRHSVDAQRGTPTIKDAKTHQSCRISLDRAAAGQTGMADVVAGCRPTGGVLQCRGWGVGGDDAQARRRLGPLGAKVRDGSAADARRHHDCRTCPAGAR